MNPQTEFLKYLRFKRSLLACDEVASYGCIADVLAVDKNKKHILEYEFKNNSADLKINEPKKYKYQQQIKYVKGRVVRTEYKQPHRFYFVVPHDLWEKEEAYLESQGCGVIMYSFWTRGEHKGYDFLTMKPCRLRKKNLQKYHVAARDILQRGTSAYVNLLLKVDLIHEHHAAEIKTYKTQTHKEPTTL